MIENLSYIINVHDCKQRTSGISATWNPTGEVSFASSSKTPSE